MNRYLIRANGQADMREIIRTALKERGISQAEAADHAGIAYWRLVSCFAANTWFQKEEVAALAEVLDLSVDELVGDSVFQDDPRVRWRPLARPTVPAMEPAQ